MDSQTDLRISMRLRESVGARRLGDVACDGGLQQGYAREVWYSCEHRFMADQPVVG